MNRLLVVCFLVGCTGEGMAQESENVFAELDAKIEEQLTRDLWHPASTLFIRTQWAEYQQAHKKPGQRGDFHGAICYGGFLCGPEIEEIKQYAGDYNFKSDTELPPGPHLQIVISPNNRVFVIEDGLRMPAVVNNKIIFFTNGELIKQNAQLGSKPYARLDLRMIYQARHFGLVTGPTDSFVDDMLRLVKVENKTPKAP